MKVNEFNWNTYSEEEIRKEIEAIENAEDLQELGIDNEEEKQDYLDELEDMLQRATYNETYEEHMADIIHDEQMLGL